MWGKFLDCCCGCCFEDELSDDGEGDGYGGGAGRPNERTHLLSGEFKALGGVKEDGNIRQRYKFGKVLGQGGFATVRQATDKVTGEVVAIKAINPKHFITHRDRLHVAKEIEVLQRVKDTVRHPGMVRLIAVYQDRPMWGDKEGRVYIVMECAIGGDLFDRIIAKGHYAEKDACGLFYSILGMVHALHQGGVVHRDLKPENIVFVDEASDANVKLVDFGLAFQLGERDIDEGRLVGTVDYAPPEALRPPHYYSPATDVWALGVILHIMLVGYSPFWAQSDEQLRALICSGTLRFEESDWVEISVEARDLVTKMLNCSPARRATLEEAMQHPWVRDQRRRSIQHLDATMGRLRNFNARRKFKAAARALMFAHVYEFGGVSQGDSEVAEGGRGNSPDAVAGADVGAGSYTAGDGGGDGVGGLPGHPGEPAAMPALSSVADAAAPAGGGPSVQVAEPPSC